MVVKANTVHCYVDYTGGGVCGDPHNKLKLMLLGLSAVEQIFPVTGTVAGAGPVVSDLPWSSTIDRESLKKLKTQVNLTVWQFGSSGKINGLRVVLRRPCGREKTAGK